MELREIERWVNEMREDDELLESLAYVTNRNVGPLCAGSRSGWSC